MMRQIEHDEWGTVKVNTIRLKNLKSVQEKEPEHDDEGDEGGASGRLAMAELIEMKIGKGGMVEEVKGKEAARAWDDITGTKLDPEAVKAARIEEIGYVKKHEVCSKVNDSACRLGKR